jgi:sigma-B regulation protein RsbQ
MRMLVRHNITESGDPAARPMIFAHGFGCDQHMWRFVTPHFDDHRVIVFDHIGAGGSDSAAYDPARYASLDGYAQDVIDICRELDLRDAIFVGHSVSAMIGVLAAQLAPERISELVLVSPSPRYIDDGDYRGGFSEQDIDDLLDSLESNYLGWSSQMAPVIMGHPDRPELAVELETSFCRADPAVARRFAAVTFRSDNRADLPRVQQPTLVLQCSNDAIAPVSVGTYVSEHMPHAQLRLLEATGHCPNLSEPEETAKAIRQFLDGPVPAAR